MLISVSNKYEGLSYSQLGTQALGSFGKFLCDITLALSQTSFVISYTVFIVQNVNEIFASYSGFKFPKIYLYVL